MPSVLKEDASLRMLTQMAFRPSSICNICSRCLLIKKLALGIFVNFDFTSINKFTEYAECELDNHMRES